MKNQDVVRDERTLAVENASYRVGYLFLAFGLLLVVAYRGVAMNESNWDLMALVILSGLVATAHQGLNQILNRKWAIAAAAAIALSLVAAWAIVIFGAGFAILMLIPVAILFAVAFRKAR